MYNSQYYTCEQIDERLLQGYLDDYNSQTGQSLTKAQFLTKLGSIFSKEGTIDNTLTQIGYYECDTAAGTAAKVITVANYSLFAGGSMKVKFVNKNTANNATLNINSQGAKALYYNGVRVSSTNTWDAGEVVEIYYDGTSYYANNVKGSTGDGVFDISVYNPTEGQPTPYADLASALGPNGQNVPVQYRKGGMSVKFVLSSDNNYIQARCMAQNFTTDVTQWQSMDIVKQLMQNINILVGEGPWQAFGKTDWKIGDKFFQYYSDHGHIREVTKVLQDGASVGDMIDYDAPNDALYVVNGCFYTYKGDESLVRLKDIQDLIDLIGSLSSLSTTDKNSIVSAINELKSNIGELSNLDTTQKGNIVAAINEIFSKFDDTISEPIDTGYYINTNGISIGSTFIGSEISLNGYACINGLPVSEGDTFYFYGIGSANNAFKCYIITDKDDKVIDMFPVLSNTDYRTNPYRINIPEGGKKLYVNYPNGFDAQTDKLLKIEPIDLKALKNDIEIVLQTVKLKNKTIVCFGDSITEFKDNDGAGKSYPDYLRDISSADVVNVGIGGTRLSQRTTVVTTPTTTSEAYAALDIVSMVEASCNQQFTAQVNAAQYLKDNTEDDNTAIVARLQAIDWSQVDIVTILGGTNDWASSVPLGTSGSYDKSTVYGAINTIFRDITYKYPKIKVFYFCPPIRIIPTSYFKGGFNGARTYNVNDEVLYQHALYRFVNSHTGVWNVNDATLVPASDLYAQSSDVQTYGGVTLESLSQSILQEVKKNHIPICDLYHELWTPYNFTNACNSDLTHPFNGFAQIAAKINSFILSNKSFV